MKTSRLMWIALALAGCGPAATHATVGNTGTPHVAATQHPAPTACPTGDVLAKTAMKAWSKTVGSADSTCLALYVDGRSVWLIDGWWTPPETGGDDDETIGSWAGLITADGQVLWADGADDLPTGTMDKTEDDNYQAVDFDGDGSDEVLYEVDYDYGGESSSSLIAAGIRDGKLQAGASLPLASDNSAAEPDPADAHSCAGAYQVIDGPSGEKRIEITGSGVSTGDDCAAQGRHVYRWNGTTLVEVTGGS